MALSVFKFRNICAIVLVAVFVLSLLSSNKAHADVNDFVIRSFDSELWLDNSQSGGNLKVDEKISVEFHDNNHGILRALPETYRGRKLNLKINQVEVDGVTGRWSTDSTNDNTVLKIGDPDKTITGIHTYHIVYTYQNVIDFYDNHDEFYWDINGDQWLQPALIVRARIHVPSNVTIQQQKCFAGSYAATAENCTITKQDDVIDASALNLSASQTLTTVIGFNKGYFVQPPPANWLRDNAMQLAGAVAALIGISSWGLLKWRRDGKDLPGRGVVVPEYSPPKQLRPAEAAAIYAYKSQTTDITATIVDLAIRKYIKIIETKKNIRFAPDTITYQLELLRADTEGLKDYEIEILKGIFTDISAGKTVQLGDLKDKFYTTAATVSKDTMQTLTNEGYFYKNPLKAGTRMLVLGIIAIGASFILGNIISLGFLVSGLLLIGLSFLMSKRTQKGVEIFEYMKGLKLYIETAEKDRIDKLQAPDAAYAAVATEPVKTVELFEKLLPYAMVLGVEKKWADKFQNIYTTPPDWYSGNWTTFNTAYLLTSLNNANSAMATSFSPPSSSGSSGFSSGGGFSGGGGGGGGGGGW